jgi:hypothetical protein
MSMAHDISTGSLYRRLAAAAERIIAALDALEAPEEDLEDDDPAEEGGDMEPSLGATNHPNQAKAWNSSGWAGDDAEFDGDTVADPDLEDGHDREHDEAELSGIGDLDGYQEQLVGEPSLGATLDVDQRVAWGADRVSGIDDGEMTGTAEDLASHKSAETWQADRAAADSACDQVRAIVRRKRGPHGVVGVVR